MDRQTMKAQIIIEMMEERFGDRTPNYDHCPREFEHNAKMIAFYKAQEIEEKLVSLGY